MMRKWFRKSGILLAVLAMVWLLPGPAQAVETENRFVLSAEANGKLVIAPEYVKTQPGQTIAQALQSSGHSFTGLEQGWITAIDGVAAEYTRSDEAGGYDLNAQASTIGFFRFSDGSDSTPGENLRQLMTAMADYSAKSKDVQLAAKESYDNAFQKFPGVTEELAQTLAIQLTQAMENYEDSLQGETFTLRLGDGNKLYSRENFPGVTIQAENAYGRVWTDDDGDGTLTLPQGTYRFALSQNGSGVRGSVTGEADVSVTVELPTANWLKTDTFRLSTSYGETDFTDGELPLSDWSGRTVTASVRDTVSGGIYVYAEHDPKETPAFTAIYQMASSGTAMEKTQTFQSCNSGAYQVLAEGSQGNTVVYRLEMPREDGYTDYQDYTVQFNRIPTLQALSLTDQEGTALAPNILFSPDTQAYTYKVLDTVTSVTVHAQAREGYTISVNGGPLAENAAIDLTGETQIKVTVASNGFSTDYLLDVCPGQGKTLSFLSDKSVTVQVTNSHGVVMPFTTHKETETQNRYKYTLVPGETYHYIATKDTWYHITDDFTLEEVANSLIQLDFGTTEHWLQSLSFGKSKGSGDKGTVAMTEDFSPEKHSYTLTLPDTEHLLYTWVTADSGITVQASYTQLFNTELYMGKTQTLDLTSGASEGVRLNRFLMYDNPVENTVTIRLSKKKGTDGVTLYQDYQVKVARTLTLENMSVTVDGTLAAMQQSDGTTGFDKTKKEYTLLVGVSASQVQAQVTCYEDNLCYGEETMGYRLYANGQDITESKTFRLTMDGTMNAQTLTIRVENDKAPTGSSEYTLNILKSPPVEATFTLQPETALLDLRESVTGQRVEPGADGTYLLSEGYTYRYSLTCKGYVGKSGTLEVTRDHQDRLVIREGTTEYPVTSQGLGGSAEIRWSLDEAPANTGLQTGLSAQWPSFRGNGSNNAVTDAPTPFAAAEGTLYWATKLGSGTDSDAVGSPILVDGDIITYASDQLYRLDTATGAVKARGTMCKKSSFAITPPVYADGMIFVALSEGTIQAFDAVTLESLWLYQDPLGGQPDCPITVKGGYLYTGFWNGETSEANYVCLTVTDEDPTRSDETKPATWYYTVKGGFYWAGACMVGDKLLVGTDDGFAGCTSQTARLLLLDGATGRLLDSWENLNGDIRSTVVYDSGTGACYFTSKGGSFYSAKVSAEGKLTDKWSIALENGSQATPMSTSTPVVYNGRAYVGVCGAGQFSADSGHSITVIDLQNRTIAYRADTAGYPQCSGLLTTAYGQGEGWVYVYFFENMETGKLRVLRDRPGQTRVDYVTVEGDATTAYALFTPTGDQAAYAIASPICDSYGTIYFKNDSGYLMAFGSAITSLEVTKQPDRTTYAVGDTFDPTGMVVTAHLANGLSRDVTDLVQFSEKPLTEADTDFAIAYPYVMYHNEEEGTGMKSVETVQPVTTLTLSFAEAVLGDVNGDGTIDKTDAHIILDYEAGLRKAAPPLQTADVSGDGTIDSNDAVLIIQYAAGKIAAFPAAGRQ